MAYPTRSLAEISQAVRGAIRQYLPGTDASLKQNVLYVIGKVMTLLAGEYELRLAWLYDQLFLTTATSDAIVRLQAAEYGIYQKPAAAAFGTVSGTAAPNITYPSGVRWVSGATSYASSQPFTADALGRFTAKVRAEKPGRATNRDAGAVLNLADPALWPDISENVTVDGAGLGGGADAETMEELRARALWRKRTPPQGGALTDYERFALEVPGVVAAWARQFTNGFGTVGTWVLFAGRPAGIPTQADIEAVQRYIEDRRLVRADFVAAAPRPVPVDLTIALSPDTVTARAAVFAALSDFFDAARSGARIRPGLPGDPFTLPRSWLSEVISTSAGEDSHRLLVPSVDLEFGSGDLPVLGTVNWV